MLQWIVYKKMCTSMVEEERIEMSFTSVVPSQRVGQPNENAKGWTGKVRNKEKTHLGKNWFGLGHGAGQIRSSNERHREY